jgi:ABC-type nitrate/sulfonate/bicarbonate transport system substrate-binding protein
MKVHTSPIGRRPGYLVGAATIAIATAVAMTGCSASSTPATTSSASAGGQAGGGGQTVTVLESSPGFFDLPIHVAEDQFGAKFGLTIKLIQVQGGGAAGQEFQGGTGDIALTAVDTPLRLQMPNGVPGGVSVIGSNMHTMLYVLTAKTGSAVKSISDLGGKKIGITGPLAAGQLVVNWAMKTKFHMDPAKSSFVALGSVPTILQAVENNSVDAGVLFSPALEQGLSDKSIKVVFDFRKFPYGQNVFYARNSQLKADKSKYVAYMAAYTAAVNKMKSDPAFAFAQAKKYYGAGLSDATLHTILDFYMTKEWDLTQFSAASYKASQDMLVNSGSGFTASTIPSFADITKDTPKP